MFDKQAADVNAIKDAALKIMCKLGFNPESINFDRWLLWAGAMRHWNSCVEFESVYMDMLRYKSVDSVACVLQYNTDFCVEIPEQLVGGGNVRVFRVGTGGFISVDNNEGDQVVVRLMCDTPGMADLYPNLYIAATVPPRDITLGISVSSNHPSDAELVAAIHTLARYECAIIHGSAPTLQIVGTATKLFNNYSSDSFPFTYNDEGSYIRALVNAAQNLESKQQ